MKEVSLKTKGVCCYILQCNDGTYYTGWAKDLAKRVEQHEKGLGARYTRQRLPVRLVYSEALPDRSAAMKRERAIKKLSRPKKERLIQGLNGH
ncbi:MAG TPA: GIY-YIG nuclease family protein [Anaerolineae bacterium]|nr:GIY-YIG nuclease family protein [Anaerolineae bacterium]